MFPGAYNPVGKHFRASEGVLPHISKTSSVSALLTNSEAASGQCGRTEPTKQIFTHLMGLGVL